MLRTERQPIGNHAKWGVGEMPAPDLTTRTAQAIGRLARTASLGQPPLIEGEDGAAYNQFHGGIAASVKPKDFLEEIWVRDIADLSWEVLRLRRIKAAEIVHCGAS
jgi:hypothetical protein